MKVTLQDEYIKIVKTFNLFGHSDHAWLWTLKRTELLLNYSYHLWSSQILYLHTPQDTINLSYKQFRIWKIYLMRVPYCKTLLLLSCKLLFTSIQSTTKYIVFFKMPSYDFSISSCSLNIFSQETEKSMIFFHEKKTHIKTIFPAALLSMCRQILMDIPWNWLQLNPSTGALYILNTRKHVLLIASSAWT